MRRLAQLLTCAFALLALFGCAPAGRSSRAGEVTGTVRAEAGAFPGGTNGRLVLEIRDTSVTGGQALLAEANLDAGPGWEIAGTHGAIDFRVPCDPRRIDPAHEYLLLGRIMEGETTVGITQAVPVLTRGAPEGGITLTMGGPTAPGASASSQMTGSPWLDAGPPRTGAATPGSAEASATTPSAP